MMKAIFLFSCPPGFPVKASRLLVLFARTIFWKRHKEKNTFSVTRRLVSHHVIPPLMENDGVSALVGITRHNSLFHPSKDRSPDTKSLVCMHKSTDGTSTSIQIRLTLPLISQVRLRLSLVQLLEWCMGL